MAVKLKYCGSDLTLKSKYSRLDKKLNENLNLLDLSLIILLNFKKLILTRGTCLV